MFLGALSLLLLGFAFPMQKQAPSPKSNFLDKPSTKVYLKSGASFEGRVRFEDETSLRLEVSFGEVLLKKEEIASRTQGAGIHVLSEKMPEAARPVESEKTVPERKPIGFKMPPPLEGEKPAKPLVSTESWSASDSVGSDARIQGILTHYLWFLPETANTRFLIGAGFFLGFIALFFFACKLAGIEGLSLGRALAFCGVIFAAFVVQLHFDSPSLGVTLSYASVILLLWFGLVKWVLKEPYYRGAAVLAFFVFTALLGVMMSELGYVIVHAPQA